ncbi:MmgE/PrpD family protein, partial [Pseudomonas gingeri]
MSERLQCLVRFCVESRFEDLPAALVEQAKRHILDTFGAALAGADSEVALGVRRALDLTPDGPAPIWGTG